MPLPLEGPRPLSPLEREAFRLVFWDSIDPCDVYVTVIEKIEHTVKNAVATYSNGGIKFGRSRFPYTDALNIDSTLANTDIFKPANMNYLSRLIHECTHHWQSVHNKYTLRAPSGAKRAPYGISLKQLTRLKFLRDENKYIQDPENFPEEYHELYKEQHATAAQIYFLIEWQLEHSSDPLVNLTYAYSSKEEVVGPASRYTEIQEQVVRGQPGPRVSREFAKGLKTHFRVYLNDLRSGGRWAG